MTPPYSLRRRLLAWLLLATAVLGAFALADTWREAEKTADEVSAEKRVSIDTVRYQIRQIYDKLGVSSRESLFRRIRPYIL